MASGTTWTIAVGQTVSTNSIRLNDTITGLIVPANTEGTSLSFQASIDDSTFYDVYATDGTQLLAVITSGARWVAVDPNDFLGMAGRYLKVVSQAAQSGADAVITPVFQDVFR